MAKSTKKVKPTAADHRLIQAAREMLAHARGEIELESYNYTPPKKVDVSDIRVDLGLSQKAFAERYGFALSALKDWEQGRRNPERSARILLAMIASNHKAVDRVLKNI